MAIVDIRNLTCTLADGTKLLDDVTLQVEPGECVLLCGRSGMGKTTLTKCINGLIPHFEPAIERQGSVEVCGLDPAVAEAYELAERVGNVFQNPKSQFFNLTSDDELAFGLEVAGAPADLIDARVEKVAHDLAIEDLRHRDVNRMSGGEKQSLVFASVAVANPELYVLDEPTANLDHEAMSKIREQIISALREGKTVLVAEHRLDFLADLITRALVVEKGRIVRQLTSEELLALPDAERIALGLRDPVRRAWNPQRLAALPENPHTGAGLRVQNLAVSRKGSQPSPAASFVVPHGSVLGLVGANGSGKTTLLRALAGLESKATGDVLLDQTKLLRRQRRHRFSYVMQDVNHQLFSDSVWVECEMSVSDRFTDRERENLIRTTLARLDLADKADVHPMALSGGQKQRLAIASCLLAEREVLLMDEPTSGLDFCHMMEVTSLIRTLAKDGLCIVVATHDQEFLEQACDCVYRIAR